MPRAAADALGDAVNTIHPSVRHVHGPDCIRPVREIIPAQTRSGQNEMAYDVDGVCRRDGWKTSEGCSVLRIPIFRRDSWVRPA